MKPLLCLLSYAGLKWSPHPDVRRAFILTKDAHCYPCSGGFGAAIGSLTRTSSLENLRAVVKHYCRVLKLIFANVNLAVNLLTAVVAFRG